MANALAYFAFAIIVYNLGLSSQWVFGPPGVNALSFFSSSAMLRQINLDCLIFGEPGRA